MRGDTKKSWPVEERTTLGVGAISTFVNEVVRTPTGQTMDRQFLTHPGAVAVVAWDEVEDTILVLRQYRHPVGMELVEVPAGLLDIEGEDYLLAAQRELAEEAEMQAERWDVLVDIFTTPGACEESLRVFLARDLSPAPRPAGFVPEDEESEMSVHLEAREDLVRAILAGDCQSPPLVSGVMALEVARFRGQLDSLRPSDAPWRARQ